MDIENKPKKILESGQILVEIEPNIWVDYESYLPTPITETPQDVQLNTEG